jgi:hypothetical protein
LIARKSICRDRWQHRTPNSAILLEFLLVSILFKPLNLVLLILNVSKFLVYFLEALAFFPNFDVFSALSLQRQPTESDGLLIEPNPLLLPDFFF